MKKIKVFCFPTHMTKDVTPGVDYVRMILPMRELQKDPRFEVTIFDNTLPSKELSKFDWREVAQEYDILYINYLTLPFDFALIGMLFRKYRKKIVFDIDDLIWDIQEDNSSYGTYAPGSEGRAVVTDIVRECDYITCTNTFLKNGIAQYCKIPHKKIKVFPNRIDLSLYNWSEKPPKKHTIRIGYFGSSSHFNDLGSPEFTKALDRLMNEYPNLEFDTIGAMLASCRKKYGRRYITDFGHQDIYTWVKMFPEKIGDIDIFAVPLVDTTYCRAKSSIKFLEMSSTKRPGCWQNIRQYQELVEDGKNGFLCKTEQHWYHGLKRLIDESSLRHSMGEEAYKTIEGWQMKDHVHEYADFFIDIMKQDDIVES